MIVRRNGFIDVLPVESIVPHRTSPKSGRRYTTDGGGYEAWDGERWVPVLARKATWHDEEMITLHGRGGVVSATADHVVFMDDGSERPMEAVVDGDHIQLASQPPSSLLTTMTDDEAWLLGVLTAEGHIGAEGKGRVTCRDEAVLSEAAAAWERVAAGSSRKWDGAPSAFSETRTPALDLTGNRAYLRMLREELYCADGGSASPSECSMLLRISRSPI